MVFKRTGVLKRSKTRQVSSLSNRFGQNRLPLNEPLRRFVRLAENSSRGKGKPLKFSLAECNELIRALKQNPAFIGRLRGRQISLFSNSLSKTQAVYVGRIASNNPALFVNGLGVNLPFFFRGLGPNAEGFARGLGKNAGLFARALGKNAGGFAHGVTRNSGLFVRGLGKNTDAFARGLGQNAGPVAALLDHSWFTPRETNLRLTGKQRVR